MNRHFLIIVAIVAALALAGGFAGLDRMLAEAVHRSGLENARVFTAGLYALDSISGLGVFIWACPIAALLAGAGGVIAKRQARWPRTVMLAGVVQSASIVTMIAMKNHFGRLRPWEAFAAARWDQLWYAGGVSFPSGHSAFYFGLLLPLAAATRSRWLRAALLAIALFAICARIDMARHFLSDVSASALFVSLYALVAATIARHWLPAPTVRPHE